MDQDIVVIEAADIIPESAQFIGEVKVGDSGMTTNCGYLKMLEKVKQESRLAGANIVYLIKVDDPSLRSSCYRIKAAMYRDLDQDVIEELADLEAQKNASTLPHDADYAIVYFYRPRNYVGSAIGFKVRHKDEIIGKARNGKHFSYQVSEPGEYVFWGKTEKRDSVTIQVELGEEYYVRCGVQAGAAIGRPEMFLIEPYVGREEYGKMVK